MKWRGWISFPLAMAIGAGTVMEVHHIGQAILLNAEAVAALRELEAEWVTALREPTLFNVFDQRGLRPMVNEEKRIAGFLMQRWASFSLKVTSIAFGAVLAIASPASVDALQDDIASRQGFTALQNGDYEVAIREFRSLVHAGEQGVLGSLGYSYQELARATLKRSGDYRSVLEAGIRDLQPFADEGKAEAEYWLGQLYRFQSNDQKAAKWLLRAAHQEHAMAQWELGTMYRIGPIGSQGLAKDFYEARQWFEKAANNGLGLGMEGLGRLYAEGKGVAKNYSVAIKWLQRAIEQGDHGALIALGSMYESGKGVSKDGERANEFYRKAASLGDYNAKRILEDKPLAEKGDADAQHRIGEGWLGGIGVVEDIDEALHFLGKAADQGYVRAIRTVGYMYQTGWKVPQDFVLAHKWYNIAASLGDEKSGLDRDEVARLMTPGQIAEAQKLAREWVASQRKK